MPRSPLTRLLPPPSNTTTEKSRPAFVQTGTFRIVCHGLRGLPVRATKQSFRAYFGLAGKPRFARVERGQERAPYQPRRLSARDGVFASAAAWTSARVRAARALRQASSALPKARSSWQGIAK
jgi:hypothetical protein